MYQDEFTYSGMIYFAKGGRGGSAGKGGGRVSSHPGPGGNWPSTTGQPSGSGRGNGASGK